jgi:mRNA-degrading endonuclease RelE of RelBE toxin-antitoxin system
MWQVEYTKRFLKELSGLPKEIRTQVEGIVFGDLTRGDPFSLGYLERMVGYPGNFKIRIGNYRIGIVIEKASNTYAVKKEFNPSFSGHQVNSISLRRLT